MKEYSRFCVVQYCRPYKYIDSGYLVSSKYFSLGERFGENYEYNRALNKVILFARKKQAETSFNCVICMYARTDEGIIFIGQIRDDFLVPPYN